MHSDLVNENEYYMKYLCLIIAYQIVKGLYGATLTRLSFAALPSFSLQQLPPFHLPLYFKKGNFSSHFLISCSHQKSWHFFEVRFSAYSKLNFHDRRRGQETEKGSHCLGPAVRCNGFCSLCPPFSHSPPFSFFFMLTDFNEIRLIFVLTSGCVFGGVRDQTPREDRPQQATYPFSGWTSVFYGYLFIKLSG